MILQITDNQGNVSQSIQPAYINVLDGDNVSLDFLLIVMEKKHPGF